MYLPKSFAVDRRGYVQLVSIGNFDDLGTDKVFILWKEVILSILLSRDIKTDSGVELNNLLCLSISSAGTNKATYDK